MKGLLLLTLSALFCWVSGEHLGAPKDRVHLAPTFTSCPNHRPTLSLLKTPRVPRPNGLSSPVRLHDRVLAPLPRTHAFILPLISKAHSSNLPRVPGFQVLCSPLLLGNSDIQLHCQPDSDTELSASSFPLSSSALSRVPPRNLGIRPGASLATRPPVSSTRDSLLNSSGSGLSKISPASL